MKNRRSRLAFGPPASSPDAAKPVGHGQRDPEQGTQPELNAGIFHAPFYHPPTSLDQTARSDLARPLRGRAGLALPFPVRQAKGMFRDLVNIDSTGRWQFSLATLLRITFLVAMALGWLSLVATARPPFVMTTVIGITASLAVIVGWRRNGTRAQRAIAGFLFVLGGILVSCYSYFVAQLVQMQSIAGVPHRHPWADLDQPFLTVAIPVSSPAMLVILVLMLRAWTWSAHDWSDR